MTSSEGQLFPVIHTVGFTIPTLIKTAVGSSDYLLMIDGGEVPYKIAESNFSVPTVYEYWRIINTVPAGGNSQGRQWICREFRFLDSNENLISVGGTPQAYSLPGTDPSPAFDNNTTTCVTLTSQSQPTTGLGIGYRFPNPLLPAYVEISNLNNGFNIPPTDYSLQKSSDNANWIVHQNFTIATDDVATQSIEVVGAVVFDPNNPKYQWWRIINASPAEGGNAQWICRELRFLDSSNQIISVEGIAEMYSWINDNVTKVIDNNLGTFATITHPSHPNELTGLGIGYRFKRNVLPAYVEISNLNNGANIPPSDYTLQKSRDDITWINHQDFEISTVDSTFQTVAISPVPVITVPPEPIVLLLLKGNGTNESTSIIDSSTQNLIPVKIGNPVISTSKSKFEGSSIYFDGSSALNYQSPLFNVGKKDCTIELFFNLDVKAGNPNNVLWEMRPDNTNGAFPQLSFDGVNVGLYYNSSLAIVTSATITPDNWYYAAIRKIGTLVELWFQGSKIGEFTSNNWASSGRIKIGENAYYSAGSNFKGYIDEFRFTLNAARDVSIIPTAPF